MSCAEGDEGFIYEGTADYEVETLDLDSAAATRDVQVMLNLANPAAAFRWWRMPADGVGLARMEFVINNHIKVHPMALVRFDSLKDEAAKAPDRRTDQGYEDKTAAILSTSWRGAWRASQPLFHPKPVIVRMSDFKTNEYANLIGGARVRAGRGESRCSASAAHRAIIRRATGRVSRSNAARSSGCAMRWASRMSIMMIPFCRSTIEADRVLEVMADNGLKRGENGLKVYVMCEIPSNVILASEFAERFDGFSIGSNDLTQLTLGVDRDSGELAELFDEQDAAVKWMIESVITARTVPAPRSVFAGKRRATTRNSPSSWSLAASIQSQSARTALRRSKTRLRKRNQLCSGVGLSLQEPLRQLSSINKSA